MATKSNVPIFKRNDAQLALAKAKGVTVRLRAMRNTKSMIEFVALREALKFDLDALNYSVQTL